MLTGGLCFSFPHARILKGLFANSLESHSMPGVPTGFATSRIANFAGVPDMVIPSMFTYYLYEASKAFKLEL
jgi:gamma-glutamyl:cysteine ligase YbdK (ATP-grasp superfamily)